MAAQLPDIIILKGQRMDLYSNPLEEYWIKMKKKKPAFYKLISTQRGYIATWEIKDKELFLIDVQGKFLKRILLLFRKVSGFSVRNLFRRHSDNGIKATWFSGKLRIPTGPMTMYEDRGYDSRFENELIITIEKGIVIKMVSLDYMPPAFNCSSGRILRRRVTNLHHKQLILSANSIGFNRT